MQRCNRHAGHFAEILLQSNVGIKTPFSEELQSQEVDRSECQADKRQGHAVIEHQDRVEEHGQHVQARIGQLARQNLRELGVRVLTRCNFPTETLGIKLHRQLQKMPEKGARHRDSEMNFQPAQEEELKGFKRQLEKHGHCDRNNQWPQPV